MTMKTDRQKKIEEYLMFAHALIADEHSERHQWHSARSRRHPDFAKLDEYVRQARLEAAKLFDEGE
jgi:hypothetical protein